MTPEELAAAITLICGETVKFEYSVRTKRGKATSTWKMHQAYSRGGREEWVSNAACVAEGSTKSAAMENMEVVALKWADAKNEHRDRMRKYWEAINR